MPIPEIPDEIKNEINSYLKQITDASIECIYSLFDYSIEITTAFLRQKNNFVLSNDVAPYLKCVYNEIIMDFYLEYNGSLSFDAGTYSPLLDMYRKYGSDDPEDKLTSFLKNKYAKFRNQHKDSYEFFLKSGILHTISTPAPKQRPNNYYVNTKFAQNIIYYLEHVKYYDLSRLRSDLKTCSQLTQTILENSNYPALAQYLLEKNTGLHLMLLFLQDCLYILSESTGSAPVNSPYLSSDILSTYDNTGIVNYLGRVSASLFLQVR